MSPPPDPQPFGPRRAEPRAEELRSACLSIIDAHLMLLWDAVSVFSEMVYSLPAPDSDRQVDPADLRNDVERLIDPISGLLLDRSALDFVGERWSQRLRRQAIRRFVRSGGQTDPSFAVSIDALELKMMSQAPWAQADQLLSAFELVHSDIRRAMADRIDRMLTDLLVH